MHRLRWAPRVPMEWIDKLYKLDALGIEDTELVQKVGYRLYDRCRDCIAVSDAGQGKVACPICGTRAEVTGDRELRTVRCLSCGWSSDWLSFSRSWQHMELSSGGMRPFFEDFIASWRRARTYREKMLAINDVIHRWHWENVRAERGGVGRPGGVNLIEGSRRQVIEFLDRLTSGPDHDRWAGHRESVEHQDRR